MAGDETDPEGDDRRGSAPVEADESRPPLADQRDVERVYQPAEDSRLLADVAVEHVEEGEYALDVGTGSGYVAYRLREESGARVVATDLNPHACRQAASARLPVVRGDLTTPFPADAFDAVTFNPPYLPTDPDEEWGDWMGTALSGGEDGRAAIEPFLEDVARVLATGGVAYLLVSTLTDPDAVRNLALSHGLSVRECNRESYPFEQLLVFALRLES